MAMKPILAGTKSLQLALRQSFVLKNQCNVLREAILLLDADVKEDPGFYESNEKLCAQTLRFLKKFLRFARINLKVTEARSKGLGDLRKARSLCNVNKLRETLNGFSSDFQLLVFSSKIQKKIGTQIGQLFSGMNLAQAYNDDKAQILVLFREVFESLLKLPGLSDTKLLLDTFIIPLTSKDPFDVNMDDFDDPKLSEFSYKLEQRLLGMTTQDPTPYSALKLEKIYRKGKFGEIHRGTLGGPVPVCIQKIMPEKLQTLSSDGRIKLFSTVRTNLVKGHDNLVKVLGVTLYEDTLYVSLQNIDFSLGDLLHEHQATSSSDLNPDDLLYIFHCISSALEFLQKDGVVHGDLTPDNIFLSREAKQGYVRLANFSYELNLEELHWSTWNDESIAYQAPEVLGQKTFSAASDMYALAICVWESTQDDCRPFADHDKNHIVERVKAGDRPEFAGGAKEASWLIDIAEKCWEARPWVRPEVSSIRQQFEEIAEANGTPVESLGEFVAPLVKKTQQLISDGGANSSLIMAKRPIPGLNDGPVELEPPPPSPPRQPHRSPERQIPAVPVVAPMIPSADNREVPPRPVRNTPRELPPRPGNTPRDLPPRPGNTPRDLPPRPGNNPPADLPPRPKTNRPAPELPSKPRALPARPGEQGTPGRSIPPTPGRPLPPVQPQMPMSPPRPIPPSPPRPVREKPKMPTRQPIQQSQPTGGSFETLGRVERENNVPQPQATGVNGLTAQEVRQELIRFYEENDPDMLSELNNLVNWCMVNGLEQFEKLLVERFGKGLPMFSGEQESEPDDLSDGMGKGGGGLASIFGKKSPKREGGHSKPPGLYKP